MCERAPAIVLIAACSFLQGTALADSRLAEKAIGDPPSAAVDDSASKSITTSVVLPAVVPVAKVTTATPVAIATPASEPQAAAVNAEPSERRDRSRVLSYILLQGLQGAGPFAGAR